MRLIDADALLHRECLADANKFYEDGSINRYAIDTMMMYEIKGMIDNSPTIDAMPIVHARWVYDPNAQDWGIGGYRCSECKTRNNNLPVEEKYHPSWCAGSKFCPRCGAIMDLE